MPVRLFILGLLNECDSYGYEIKEKIKKWGMEQWTNIGWSSIYHALRKMEEEGFIEEKQVCSEGGRPPKMIYSILDKGRQELLRLLRETTCTVYEDKNPIYVVLLFITQLPLEERIELFSKRLQELKMLQGMVEKKKKFIKQYEAEFSYIDISLDRDLMHRKAEIEWVEKLIEKTKKGN